jgi:hypothetical protein
MPERAQLYCTTPTPEFFFRHVRLDYFSSAGRTAPSFACRGTIWKELDRVKIED